MTELSYLSQFQDRIDINKLLSIKEQRMETLLRDENILRMLDNLPDYKNVTFDPSEKDLRIQTDPMVDIEGIAKELIPWKKGPFCLNNTLIDSEWRSDLKWDRLKDKLNLKNKTVLDIGCNNGYFMFRALEQDPKLILGIDPVARCYYQYKFIKNFIPNVPIYFELFGMDEVELFNEVFDNIFHMGIIYHHRNPIQQLRHIHKALKPNGELIIETIGIEGEESVALFPEDRYAKMRNVWFVPTLNCLINWLQRTKFVDIEIISTEWGHSNEQRTTQWCPSGHQSYKDFLDPNNPSKTIEGYPAPKRFCLKARKKGRR